MSSSVTRGPVRAHSHRVLQLLAVVALTIAAACSASGSTSPEFEVERRANSICVRPGHGDVPADTVAPAEDGSCAVGYENIPWY